MHHYSKYDRNTNENGNNNDDDDGGGDSSSSNSTNGRTNNSVFVVMFFLYLTKNMYVKRSHLIKCLNLWFRNVYMSVRRLIYGKRYNMK